MCSFEWICLHFKAIFRRFTGGKSRNLQDAYGGKGTVRCATVLCGSSLSHDPDLSMLKADKLYAELMESDSHGLTRGADYYRHKTAKGNGK